MNTVQLVVLRRYISIEPYGPSIDFFRPAKKQVDFVDESVLESIKILKSD